MNYKYHNFNEATHSKQIEFKLINCTCAVNESSAISSSYMSSVVYMCSLTFSRAGSPIYKQILIRLLLQSASKPFPISHTHCIF